MLLPTTNTNTLSPPLPSSKNSLLQLSATVTPFLHLSRFIPFILSTSIHNTNQIDSFLNFVNHTHLHLILFKEILNIPKTKNYSTKFPGLQPLIAACLNKAFIANNSFAWFHSIVEATKSLIGGNNNLPGDLLIELFVSSVAQKSHQLLVLALFLLPAFSPKDPAHIKLRDLVIKNKQAYLKFIKSNSISQPLNEYIEEHLENTLRPLASNSTMTPDPISANNNENTIASLLYQAGYNVLSSPDVLYKCLVDHLGSPKSVQAALSDPVCLGQALGAMMLTLSELKSDINSGSWSTFLNDQSPLRSTWSAQDFVDTIRTHASPHPDWIQVFKHLDYEGFQVLDLRAFEFMLETYKIGSMQLHNQNMIPKKFPIKQILFTPWKYCKAQYSLLVQCASSPPDVFNFAEYPPEELTRVIPAQVLAAASSQSRTPITSLPNQALNILAVHSTLLQLLNKPECADDVKQFLINASVQTPELLLLGLVQLPGDPWDGVHAERINVLTDEFILGKPSSAFVLKELWRIVPHVVKERMGDLHNKDGSRLNRILDVCQDLHALLDILKTSPFTFGLNLASFASRQHAFNLDQWVSEMVIEHGDTFARACLDFVKEKLDTPQSPVSADIAGQFVKSLEAHQSGFPPELNTAVDKLKQFIASKTVSKFSEETERQVMDYFTAFYKDELNLDVLVSHLISLSRAQDNQSQDLFTCAICTFLDERKFFGTYPERTLVLSGAFLGQVLQHDLLSLADSICPLSASADKQAGKTMQETALTFIIDALRQPETSKMFQFGLRALQQFTHRANEFSSFASELAQMPNVISHIPELDQLLQDRFPSKLFKSIVVDECLVTELNLTDPPPNTVQDKLLFILNNLSQVNLETKAKETQALLDTDHYRWFAQHLVRRRAAQELNFQPLYLGLLRAWTSKPLDRAVLYETYLFAETVLNSEKAWEEPSERTKLKHIGTWLGGLTLALDRPIMYKHLAMKELLLEGYDHGRLMVAVPFVCQILKEAKHSTIFLPPNPWLMAILGVLVELYHFADIKLNLKFEIEVLCKAISIDLCDIRPTELLKFRRLAAIDHPPESLISHSGNLPSMSDTHSTGGIVPPAGDLISQNGSLLGSNIPGAQPTSGHLPSSIIHESAHEILLNLASHIVLSPSVMAHPSPGGLKRLMHVAFDRAIRETLAPVVERSVTIAAISTRELVLKDFSAEPDEHKVRTASHLMSQNLAGSLALVTCKEPLRIAMVTHLRSLMLQNGLTEQAISDQLLFVVVTDNLDLGCHIIARAAMEKAAPELDEQLSPSVHKRKRAREMGQPFYEISPATAIEYQRRLASLPDQLKLKVGGLSSYQLAVYEEYARVPGSSGGRGGMASTSIEEGPVGTGVSEEATLQQSIDRFTKAMAGLDAQLTEASMVASIDELPPSNEVQQIIRQITQYLPSPSNSSRDDVALMFCTKILQLLFSATTDISRETYAIVLREICAASMRAGREVVQWLLYANDERKYNVLATTSLIRVQVIPLLMLDAQLGKLIESGKNLIEFATELVSTTIQLKLASTDDWFNTINLLFRLEQVGKAPETVHSFLQMVRRLAIQQKVDAAAIETSSEFADTAVNDTLFATNLSSIETDDVQDDVISNDKMLELDQQLLTRDRLTYLFTEWVKITALPNVNEKLLAAGVSKLHQSIAFSSDDNFCLFIRLFVEHSVNVWLEASKANATAVIASRSLDPLAKLIVYLSKYHTESLNSGINLLVPATVGLSSEMLQADLDLMDLSMEEVDTPLNRARFVIFKQMIAILVLIVIGAHERDRRQFNQRPYFRLLSSLLYELNQEESSFIGWHLPMINVCADAFHALQPAVVPGFSFAWLALLAHRQFMPKLLLQEGQAGWPTYARLLLDLFRSLVPFLREGLLREPERQLYRGSLRLLLVLLHDFPEFLCEYYQSLCATILYGCLQIRNLILSAFPRNMRLPDPFTQSMRMNTLPESHILPTISLKSMHTVLSEAGLSAHRWEPILAASKMRLRHGVRDEITGSTYNVSLIQAIVLVAGHQDAEKRVAKDLKEAEEKASMAAQGIESSQPNEPVHEPVVKINVEEGSSAWFIKAILEELDSEGRFFVLTAITNHLRYPNAHTTYFSELLLYLFSQRKGAGYSNNVKMMPTSSASMSSGDALQEQITRVLLERLVANRPHPWGLLVTFIELIKNPEYEFWTYAFTNCVPDLERLFESVARSVNHR